MKPLILVFIVLSLSFQIALSQSKLIWHDEFDGTGIPNPAKWEQMEYNRRINVNGPDGWWEKDDSFLDGKGNLVIRVRKIGNRNTDNDAYDYSVGAVRTKGKFEHLYGKYEIRCRLPRQQGWWVAFWMMQGNVGKVGNGGVDGMEVDIMEAFGWTNKINYAFHWDGYGDSHQSTGKAITPAGIRDGFHTYALEWYPDKYIFYIDSVETWRSIGGGVCQSPGYIKVTGEISTESWAINSSWSNNPAIAQYPDSFIVDYVRVYDFELAEADTIAPSGPKNVKTTRNWSSVDFSWDAATDNYAVKKYFIYLDSVLIDSTSNNTITINNLESLTQYTVGIQASDYSGNVSRITTIPVKTTEMVGFTVPGIIEAEAFYDMYGIDTEDCSEGGKNVGWFEANDWLLYAIDVKQDGDYQFNVRVAAFSTGTFLLTDVNDNILSTINVNTTGGWQNWVTVNSNQVYLSKGVQIIKIKAKSAGYNINSFEFQLTTSVSDINQVKAILVYPNPIINDELNIRLPEEVGQASIQIYNLTGGLMFEKELTDFSKELKLSNLNLETGTYFVSIETNTKIYKKSFEVVL